MLKSSEASVCIKHKARVGGGRGGGRLRAEDSSSSIQHAVFISHGYTRYNILASPCCEGAEEEEYDVDEDEDEAVEEADIEEADVFNCVCVTGSGRLWFPLTFKCALYFMING